MSYTTSMGSLPCEDVNEAVDFSFKFSLPFFPELPNITADEFMLSRFEKFLKTKDSSQVCDEAFKQMVLKKDPHKIKWQVIDPFTFYRYQKSGLDFEMIKENLCEYIKLRIKFFRSFFNGELYLCLDAPALNYSMEELSSLSSFLQQFKDEKTKIGLHLCQKLENNLSSDNALFDFLAFDYLLNSHLDLNNVRSLFKELIFGLYDFQRPNHKIDLPFMNSIDGTSTVCGLYGVSNENLFTCLTYFEKLK